mgnify:CR=1 FL=1
MGTARTEQDIERRVSSAQDELSKESCRITDEIEAFEQFVGRLEAIPASSDQLSSPRGMSTLKEQPSGSGADKLREAYESTVMAVPHFSDDYDETFYENLTAEFGPELAAMIHQADHIDDRCKSTIETLCSNAIQERENLAETIQAEQEAIETCYSKLLDIAVEIDSLSTTEFAAADFGGLEAYWTRLQTLEISCDTIAGDRQEIIKMHDRAVGSVNTEASLTHYLYEELPEMYPILASIGILGTELTTIQSEIETRMMGHEITHHRE